MAENSLAITKLAVKTICVPKQRASGAFALGGYLTDLACSSCYYLLLQLVRTLQDDCPPPGEHIGTQQGWAGSRVWLQQSGSNSTLPEAAAQQSRLFRPSGP
jgi:hypothetical protein